MTSEQQSELEEIKKLISARFDEQDKKINGIRNEFAGIKKEKNKVEKILEQFGEYIDPIGKAVMGKLWRDVYITFQDAIALCLLYSIPGWISKLILNKEYSGFDKCYQDWNIWNVNRYACYVIVLAGFVLWITITGRILIRAIQTITNLLSEKTEGVKE